MFKKTMPSCEPSRGSSVMTLRARTVSEEVNGVIKTRVIHEKVDLLDPDSRPDMPTSDETRLDRLLAAGIPMKEIATRNLLNPTDPADLQFLAERGLLDIITQMPEEDTPPPSVTEVVEEVPEVPPTDN